MVTDQEKVGAPEAFVEQIKDALEHLYDLPYLQQLPLTTPESAEPAGLRLRRELAAAVDRLGEGGDPTHSAPARFAQLLRLHYLEGLTVQETAMELDLSVRQAFRDLRRAEQNLAALLWPQLAARPSAQPQATGLDEEIERIELHPGTVDVGSLLLSAVQAVTPLAEELGTRLALQGSMGLATVYTDPALARQFLIHALSQVLQQIGSGILSLSLDSEAGAPVLTVSCDNETELVLGPVAEQLARRLGWSFALVGLPQPALVLQMSRPGTRLLIIDDNQGLLDLLHRYLTGQPCLMTGTRSSTEGLRLAEETAPDAIIIDVMMPDMDGWDVLQRLRANPHTAGIPVIICSVLGDPGLARSLGASLCLRKPIDRETFLAALRELELL
jgi:CheY-like chemotaxis protein